MIAKSRIVHTDKRWITVHNVIRMTGIRACAIVHADLKRTGRQGANNTSATCAFNGQKLDRLSGQRTRSIDCNARNWMPRPFVFIGNGSENRHLQKKINSLSFLIAASSPDVDWHKDTNNSEFVQNLSERRTPVMDTSSRILLTDISMQKTQTDAP